MSKKMFLSCCKLSLLAGLVFLLYALFVESLQTTDAPGLIRNKIIVLLALIAVDVTFFVPLAFGLIFLGHKIISKLEKPKAV